jgi:hypothetical protein
MFRRPLMPPLSCQMDEHRYPETDRSAAGRGGAHSGLCSVLGARLRVESM